jgi:hypothetical protein
MYYEWWVSPATVRRLYWRRRQGQRVWVVWMARAAAYEVL